MIMSLEPGRQFKNTALTRELASGQLPMFMTAEEIKDNYVLGDVGLNELGSHDKLKSYDRRTVGTPKTPDEALAEDDLLKQKGDDSVTAGIDASVKDHGIDTPLKILSNRSSGPMLYDGHHRLASMLRHRPTELIPLEHV